MYLYSKKCINLMYNIITKLNSMSNTFYPSSVNIEKQLMRSGSCFKHFKQAISARERALCQLTVCFEFQSRSDRRKGHKSCALPMVFRCKVIRSLFRCKKYIKNIFKGNTVNAILFKLQLIYSTVRISK